MQVVDDQREGAAGRREFRAHLVDHGLAVEPRRRGRGLGAAGGGADGAQQGEPEQLRIVLARLYGHERDRAVLAPSIGPRMQQRRLSAAGGRRDDRYPLAGRVVQLGDQVVAVDQPTPSRTGPSCLRGRRVGHRAASSGDPVSVTALDRR